MVYSTSNITKIYNIGKTEIKIKPGDNQIPADVLTQLKKIPMFARNVDKGQFLINKAPDKKPEPKEPEKKEDKKKKDK